MSAPGAHSMPLNVAIIGAAIAGPTFALQILSHPILRQRFKPVLYDRSADPFISCHQDLADSGPKERQQLQTAGAAIALFANGLYPLYQLGLKDDLKAIGIETPNTSMWRSGYGTSVKVDGHATEEGKHGVADRVKYLGTMKHAGWAEDLQSYLLPMERKDLQMLLLRRVKELGGEVRWNMKLKRIERIENTGRIELFFETNDEESSREELIKPDLVVGADGSFSKVRRFVLESRDPKNADEKWMPHFFKACGIYGVSSNINHLTDVTDKVPDAAKHTHGISLPEGNLSSSPLPNGKMRWDLLIPEESVPEQQTQILQESQHQIDRISEEEWEKKILPGVFSRSETVKILRKHAGVFHPVTGTFGHLFASAERIIHGPLRQRVWEAHEIHTDGDVVLIGDAGRALLPSSGQGTSFAIEDATVLADALLNNPADHERRLEQALAQYSGLRTPRNKQIARLAWQAGKLGLGGTWYWRWLFDLSSMAAHYGGKSSHDTWPFSDRFEVKLRT